MALIVVTVSDCLSCHAHHSPITNCTERPFTLTDSGSVQGCNPILERIAVSVIAGAPLT